MYDFFIDESGVHKLSGYVTVALVAIREERVAEVEQRVREIEALLRIDGFHWARHGWPVKSKFLERVRSLDFTAHVFVYHGNISLATAFQRDMPEVMRDFSVRHIIIDGKKPRWYELRLKKALRDSGIPIRALVTARDEAYAGLRIADGIAGLTRTYYENPTKRVRVLYERYRNKITTLSGGQVAD